MLHHLPTLAEIAREAGVSMSTASRVVNGGPRRVGDAHRLRVMDAAQRLGYIPNGPAMATATGHTRMIGLLVTRFQDTRLASFVAGAIRAADDLGLVVAVGETCEADRALRTIRAFRAQRIPLILVASIGTADSTVGLELDFFVDAGGTIHHATDGATPAYRENWEHRGWDMVRSSASVFTPPQDGPAP